MNNDWLRDVLRQAARTVPTPTDRARGVFGRIARRRRQRVAAVSGVALVAVFVATALTTGSGGASGLRPADGDESPTVTATASATPDDPTVASPTAGSGDETPEPDEPVVTATPDPESALPLGRGNEKLDIYVLLDTTSSMDTHRDEFSRAFRLFETELTAQRVDVTWGLGTFKDDKDYDVNRPIGYVYRRIVAQRPGLIDLPDGQYTGGGDPPEADTLALDGALGIGSAPYTTTGDAATFRPDAKKLVLLVTDSPFKQGTGYPTIVDTIRHLVEHDVTVVGFLALDGNGWTGRHDLEEVARGTGGVAWAPIDLDGLPGNEVKAGDPLVLEIDDTGDGMHDFARALVALARRG